LKGIDLLRFIWRRLLRPVDWLLDRFTSYKIVLYCLYAYIGWGMLASALGKLSYRWYDIGLSALWLIMVCRLANLALAHLFNVPKNKESDLITALILSLILTPASSTNGFLLLGAAGVVAMVSKYVLTIRRWHIFNPAALGAFVTGAAFNHYASWWVGTRFMTPLVALGGLLILRKMERFSLALVFSVVALLITSWSIIVHHSPGAGHHIWLILVSTQLVFFASVMLPEPLTSPRKASNYLPYGLLVAFLYGFGRLRVSPEEALLIGNVFAYLIEPQSRQVMIFLRKTIEADHVESFAFMPSGKLKYQPGQYMEWTIADRRSDVRGNRRYLTLASSPTENEAMFSVRMPKPSSSFKRSLSSLKQGDKILAAQVSGNFIFPKSHRQKLAFIAGGIGITPFRSMVKYLLDSGETKPVRLLYAASHAGEFAFTGLFKAAERAGLSTAYIVTGESSPNWRGPRGKVDARLIKKAFPDFTERLFYVSGPYGFVQSVREELQVAGVPRKKIVFDYFPGYG
jgi:ferredoxin-NADP reductase